MFGWFKTKETKQTKETKETKEKSDLYIEYYPLTNRYYPKHKQNYIKRNYLTGIYETMKPFLFSFADYGKTEEEALKIIKLFSEQYLKKNVVVKEVILVNET